MPYRDDWDWLLWVVKRPLTVGRFFEPHNEHVVVLVRHDQPFCRSALVASEPLHIWLDQPEGVVGAHAAGAGWAFQCKLSG